jgi:hypothetical protein
MKFESEILAPVVRELIPALTFPPLAENATHCVANLHWSLRQLIMRLGENASPTTRRRHE